MGLSLKVQWSVKRGVGVCGLHVMRIRGPEGAEDAPHLSNYTLHVTDPPNPFTIPLTLDLGPSPGPSDSTCGARQTPGAGSGGAGE